MENAGATNTFRVLGVKAGCFVMAVDIFERLGTGKLLLLPFFVFMEIVFL